MTNNDWMYVEKLAMKIVIGNMLDKYNYRIRKGYFLIYIRLILGKGCCVPKQPKNYKLAISKWSL
jgi:hypothetical protein